MSRIKKSRKPGVGKREGTKETSKKDIEPLPKKPKKRSGHQAGNRQQEATANKNQSPQNTAPKDPRIGNKTPIDLTPVKVKNESKPKKQKQPPIAAIRIIEPIENDLSGLEQELLAIEEDPKLQTILVLQEDGDDLTEEQIDYFNEKMDRHQQLSELLGLEDEDEDDTDEQDGTKRAKSEDDLWDTLDKKDFSDYE